MSPITAARAEQDSVNANLGNSRREGAVFWLFLLLSARKMSTDFKMSFVDAGKIKRTCIPLDKKKKTNIFDRRSQGGLWLLGGGY